jgi:CHAD domain-containing protein
MFLIVFLSGRASAALPSPHSMFPKVWRRSGRCSAASRLSPPDATDRTVQDERLHEVRKAAKRARYAAEPLIPIYGQDAARYADAFEHVQAVLGDYHDVVVTQPVLRRLAAQAHTPTNPRN